MNKKAVLILICLAVSVCGLFAQSAEAPAASSAGLKYIAAAVAVGIACIAGGMAVGRIGAAAMGFSSVFVVTNALRLRAWRPSKVTTEGAVPSAADVKVETSRKESTMTKTLNVTGMMCQHCVAHVTKALEGVDGVSSVEVSLEAGTATVEAADTVSDEALVSAVTSAGYEATVA